MISLLGLCSGGKLGVLYANHKLPLVVICRLHGCLLSACVIFLLYVELSDQDIHDKM